MTPSSHGTRTSSSMPVVTPSRQQQQQRTPYRKTTMRMLMMKEGSSSSSSSSTPYHTPPSTLSKRKHSQADGSPSTHTGRRHQSNRQHSRTGGDHENAATDDDRFIPSRRRLNMDLCRRALLNADDDANKKHSPRGGSDNDGDDSSSSPTQRQLPAAPEETPLQKEYKRRMLSTLCNIPLDQLTENAEPVGLLPFGSGSTASSTSRRKGLGAPWGLCNNPRRGSARVVAADGVENTFPAPVNPFEHDTLRQFKIGRSVSGQDWFHADCDRSSYHSSFLSHKAMRKVPSSPIRILDAPDIVDDYYLNLISWSQDNVLAVALAQSVYLWNATTGDIQHLVTVEAANDYITCVGWCPTASHSHLIAVGTNLAQLHIYDGQTLQKIRTLTPNAHLGRVSALAWNPSQAQWLTSGARDSMIVNHDLRQSRSTTTSQYRGHEQEVCGLKWNDDGMCLASGGNENYLCLWDAPISQTQQGHRGSSSSTQLSRSQRSDQLPRLTLRQHKAAVKALDWCPFHRGLLASGGGTADRTIKFWNATSGAVLHSVDTGSQVCSVVWSPLSGARELCSSHGYSENQLILWKYPTMTKLQELKGHSARVLNMEKSPDGASVVSAAADETLRFWNVFSTPQDSSVSSLFHNHSSSTEFLSSLGVPTIR